MCRDAEPYGVQVELIEAEEEWHELPLPDPEHSSVQADPEEPAAIIWMRSLHDYTVVMQPNDNGTFARLWEAIPGDKRQKPLSRNW